MSPHTASTPAETDAPTHPLQPWTGRYAVSAGLFEIRPRYLPRDTQPILDDDLDCVIGYQRTFAHRSHLYDLNGAMCATWETPGKPQPADKRDPVLVVGGLWKPGVRGLTAIGLTGTGANLAGDALTQLRARFASLADVPLLYREAALACMDDPQRFAPVHILRLAMRHGDLAAPPPGLPRAVRYQSRMLIRRQPYMLDLVTLNANTTIVQFEYWRYADTLPVAGAEVAARAVSASTA